MKKKALLVLTVVSALLSGCANRYDILLSNGVRITNVSKPVLNRDEGVFVYKDGTGQLREVTAGRVVEVAPHGSSSSVQFKQPAGPQ